eukprot:Blabericola_migrator_1__11048@NODE_642_length_7106_cov_1724_731212_g82_i1_p4_GENE_NODE_642_length_7106_cov_1724_731212_g82_i1NODE_642_length_7106_cov_1724_731212_g82_i1_p4_ORF_typecomplete_len187_score18_41AspAl_Ex/PF06826_12/0_0097DUF4190/PF13828_6/6_5e02DUF4190/PF13828_6/0_061WTF/PF03303_13/0_23WTF/PF03303_13/1_6e03MARVEL/PF01284_23/12MARVEL/PF01284_23/0_34DUF373/PF04123_13/4_9Asp4/PF16996_5/1_9e03Asp4/PF16996_5/0_87DHHC/PF01529_20/81DHHC/PF01529_20/4_9DUF1129/PF06570_11/1_2DUF267/PF03268_14/0
MCLCCKPKTEFAHVFGCLPLALGSLIIGLVIGAYTAYQLYTIITHNNFPNSMGSAEWITFAMQAIIGLLIFIGLISIPAKWAKGVNLLAMGFKFILMATVVTVITSWVSAIMSIYGVGQEERKNPTKEDYIYLGILTGYAVLLFAISWWVASAFASLGRVLTVGGSGWEGKNWKEIKSKGHIEDQV